MDPQIDLGEMSALRNKARGRTSAVLSPANASSASPFDPRQLGQIPVAQLQGVEVIHKAYAEQLSDALGALLHADVEVSSVAVEQQSGSQVIEGLPDPAYLVCLATSVASPAHLQIDLSLIFPFLDLILGGSGKDATESRALTEIEREILEPISRVVARTLQDAWHPIANVNFAFERYFSKSETASLFQKESKLLVIRLQVRLQEAQGCVLIAFPSVLYAVLLGKLAPQEPAAGPIPIQDRSGLQERLLNSSFQAELLLPSSSVLIRQIYGLKVNDVLLLKVNASEPLPVHVAGQHMFLASPVRCGTQRGAQIQQVLSIVPERQEETQNGRT